MMPETRLVPMTASEFASYLARQIPQYAEENVRAGHWTQEEALEKSKKAHSALLLDGRATPNHYFFSVEDGVTAEKVGTVWLYVDTSSIRRAAFIYDLFIHEEFRGKGHGRRAMMAVESAAREVGCVSLSLHVFAHNQVARHLYTSLGYDIKSLNMVKELR